MGISYELIHNQDGLPIRVFIHSVESLKTHWHKEMEILLVLKGSVKIKRGSEDHLMKENDLVVINSREIHNISRREEDNIVLAIQIDPDYYSKYYPGFNNILFNCESFHSDESKEESFDLIRHHLARIVWESNKKQEGFQLLVASEVQLLLAHLINNCKKDNLTEDKPIDEDMERIQGIVDYINENMTRGATLQEIAEREHLNVYYLSHFIKRSLGISFQEYLNFIRLESVTRLLLNTNKSIIDISYESGFPSTKSLNRIFKREYEMSPTEYRKLYKKSKKNGLGNGIDLERVKSRTYLDVDRNIALGKLFTYLKALEDKGRLTNLQASEKQTISIDTGKEGSYLKAYWKKLTSFGRATEGLRKTWQDQFKELQEDIGFEYVRFHGIFSDDMMIVNMDSEGKVSYNWTYVDELFDFFKVQNVKPFVELGFMPSEFKSTDDTMFWWEANVSQPKNISLWTNLVKEFVKHCINRYGRREVESWYFEVWNEPELEYVFWIGTKEDYFEFYRETALAIKSIGQELKVGGPSVSHQGRNDEGWLEDFLIYCKSNKVPLDFASIHIYPENYTSKSEMVNIAKKMREERQSMDSLEEQNNERRIYFDQDNTQRVLRIVNETIDQVFSEKPELHVTEWNASSLDGNLIHDTAYVATFIIKNVLDSIGLTESLAYWTFTDLMEEAKSRNSPFQGGFGLINSQGIKKPSYMAYTLLSKLGDETIQQGDDYIVTKSGENIQVLAYNFAYFDDLFLDGDTSALSKEERYLIYENKPLKEMEINIEGLEGNYKITRYQLNRDHGSSYDEWTRMGAPENMTKEEVAYLKGRAYPKMETEYLKIRGGHKEKLRIPIHGVELIKTEKSL